MSDLIDDVTKFLRQPLPRLREGDRVRVSEHTASAYARNATGTLLKRCHLHYWAVQLDHLPEESSILGESDLIKEGNGGHDAIQT